MPCTFHFTRKFVLLGVGVSALTGGAFSSISSQQSKVKLPPLVDSPQVVALGRALFHDKTLSDPEGMACVSCHDPKTGYSYPSSFVNAYFGTVPGAVRNRFGNRRPPSLAYAPFMKKGVPHYD